MGTASHESQPHVGQDAHTEATGPARGVLWARAIEFTLLFGVLPALMWQFRSTFGFLIIPLLVAMLLVCGGYLVWDRSFDSRRLWLNGTGASGIWPVLLAFVPLAAIVGLGVWLLMPEQFLSLPRRRPELWRMIMVLYPIFSVYPQEVIFRAFFFHRYRGLFRGQWAMILASGLAFGWAHLLFNHWLSVAMTAVGGVLFAWTYARTKSTIFASIEHALWGDFVFTIGLGAFFYGGSAIAQS